MSAAADAIDSRRIGDALLDFTAWLDRLDGMIAAMRREKRKILGGTAAFDNFGLRPSPMNSADHDCAAHVMYTLPSATEAKKFTDIFPSVIAGKTGRHTYTEWDQVLIGAGAAHPEINEGGECRTIECAGAQVRGPRIHLKELRFTIWLV